MCSSQTLAANENEPLLCLSMTIFCLRTKTKTKQNGKRKTENISKCSQKQILEMYTVFKIKYELHITCNNKEAPTTKQVLCHFATAKEKDELHA